MARNAPPSCFTGGSEIKMTIAWTILLSLQRDVAGVSQSIALRLPNRLALQGQPWDGGDGLYPLRM
jgi:hypothetical protein